VVRIPIYELPSLRCGFYEVFSDKTKIAVGFTKSLVKKTKDVLLGRGYSQHAFQSQHQPETRKIILAVPVHVDWSISL